MSGQVAVMAESALPDPPTSDEFFAVLERVYDPHPEDTTPADSALFGDLFEEEEGNENTHKNFEVTMRAVHDFAAVLHTKGVTLSDLDAWFLAFSKWVLAPECILDEPEKVEQCKIDRQEMCKLAGVPYRAWCPNTLKSSVNTLALKFRETNPRAPVVASSMKQLAQYNRFWKAAGQCPAP